MTDLKTTIFGVGAAIAYLVYKILTHQPLTVQDFILAAGMAGTGAAAKDATTHSTPAQVQQSGAEARDKMLAATALKPQA